VYRWTLRPGQSSGLHAHELPYVIVAVKSGELLMMGPNGEGSMNEQVKPGDFHFVNTKVTHSLTNAGEEPLEFVEIELK
jgi:oxalate decarboxylase/phosphoglucose isomerase-like protein (cupin superfamily)